MDQMIRRFSKSDKYAVRDGHHRHGRRSTIFTQSHFNSEFDEIPKIKNSLCGRLQNLVRSHCDAHKTKKRLRGLFPMCGWLRQYDVRKYLVADLIAGITVTIFHVPQSFGYAMLAGVPAVNGLYTAMFPMIMYAVFGTSRQNSVGALAVICMMTGRRVMDLQDRYSAVDVATTMAFFVGIFQLLFGIVNLGSLSVFLSDQFVSGFTAGVSVHIGSSQLGNLFGINVGKSPGLFPLVQLYINFFRQITETHWPTLALSGCTVALMLIVKIFIDPHVEKRIKVPVPIEMVVVIVGTLVSRFMQLEDHGFAVVQRIPKEIAPPHPPQMSLDLISEVAGSAFGIAIVSFAITVSLGRIFARRHRYEIEPNQEFIALGMSNLFGSFFGCIPVGASVPRSSIQDNVGGRTQLVSLINSALITVVILSVGSYLEKIPIAVLSAIIFVSLKKIFMQVRDLKNFWNISKIDGHVWLVTFFATVIFGVKIGLIVGVVFSLLTLVFKIQRPKTCILGYIPNTDYFVPTKKYGMAKQIEGIKVFHFGGPLHFANAEFFKNELCRRTSVYVSKILATRQKQETTEAESSIDNATTSDVPSRPRTLEVISESMPSDLHGSTNSLGVTKVSTIDVEETTKHIILDFSRVSFVDGTSTLVLKLVARDFQSIGITLYVACCSQPVMSMLQKGEVLQEIPPTNFFPSIGDAVKSVTKHRPPKEKEKIAIPT
ncbi:prestin-like [Ornithodoros turicata]|uniref:prestin-like n=1 Tax=Ornithodoros turicata TaxID=34597 RepID=UPI00313925B8